MTFKDIGHLTATSSVADLQSSSPSFSVFLTKCLNRYVREDWGDMSEEDKQQNDKSLRLGNERIMAAYAFPKKHNWRAVSNFGIPEEKIWIITECDHSVTTILFPSEY